MPPVLPGKRAAGTPLAPSVEKAYYRKCIQLKRRLNEVEAANEEARVRRVRLDRAIMKMRLERAFLLEQLSKRVEPNVEGSEASGEEGVGTPPGDRPHRDKRRRSQPIVDGAGPFSTMPPPHSLYETRDGTFDNHNHVRKLLKPRTGATDSPDEIDNPMARREAHRPHPSHIPSPYNADLPYATSTRG